MRSAAQWLLHNTYTHCSWSVDFPSARWFAVVCKCYPNRISPVERRKRLRFVSCNCDTERDFIVEKKKQISPLAARAKQGKETNKTQNERVSQILDTTNDEMVIDGIRHLNSPRLFYTEGKKTEKSKKILSQYIFCKVILCYIIF